MDVAARRRISRGVSLVARRLRSGHFAIAVLSIPLAPVFPPTAGMLRGAGQPGFRVVVQIGIEEIPGLGIGRWIHDALYVPARRQHDVELAAQDVPRLIASLPGCDVI